MQLNGINQTLKEANSKQKLRKNDVIDPFQTNKNERNKKAVQQLDDHFDQKSNRSEKSAQSKRSHGSKKSGRSPTDHYCKKQEIRIEIQADIDGEDPLIIVRKRDDKWDSKRK